MSLRNLLFILASAFAWAKMEVQIEGKNGWAKSLPTWRIEKHFLLDLLMGGRPLTGYHLWAFSFTLLAFHAPFFLGDGGWDWARERHVWASYAFFWILEDFLWFILNPEFGLKLFRRKSIWWHKYWWWGLPRDYWILGGVGLILTIYK